MIDVDAWLRQSHLPARLIMQVHDELVLEVADNVLDTVAAELRRHMSQAAQLAVPLKVDVGKGRNWDEAH
jgi:DNA polymerase-1